MTPDPNDLSAEAPEADVIEQATVAYATDEVAYVPDEVAYVPDEEDEAVRPPESEHVSEADWLDQQKAVPLDDDPGEDAL